MNKNYVYIAFMYTYILRICNMYVQYIPELLTESFEDILLNEGVLFSFSFTPLVLLDIFLGGTFGGSFDCFYKKFPSKIMIKINDRMILNKVSINTLYFIPPPLQKIRHNYQGINHESLCLLKYLQTSLCHSIQQL
jgi:hypothetical protein